MKIYASPMRQIKVEMRGCVNCHAYAIVKSVVIVIREYCGYDNENIVHGSI